jgi:hypothetical protein
MSLSPYHLTSHPSNLNSTTVNGYCRFIAKHTFTFLGSFCVQKSEKESFWC